MEQVSIQNLSHIGDLLAIPFFLLLTVYFYQLKNKTILEYILLLFAVSGFVLDTLFTYDFLTSR